MAEKKRKLPKERQSWNKILTRSGHSLNKGKFQFEADMNQITFYSPRDRVQKPVSSAQEFEKSDNSVPQRASLY